MVILTGLIKGRLRGIICVFQKLKHGETSFLATQNYDPETGLHEKQNA